jgi:periplasmic protein TonB
MSPQPRPRNALPDDGAVGERAASVPLATAETPPATSTSAPEPAGDAAPTASARADHRQCAPAPHPVVLRERGIEGAVVLRVRVDVQGRPADVQVLVGSGWRLFDEAALQQARGCRFFPARRSGQALDSWVEFPVRFTLSG